MKVVSTMEVAQQGMFTLSQVNLGAIGAEESNYIRTCCKHAVKGEAKMHLGQSIKKQILPKILKYISNNI